MNKHFPETASKSDDDILNVFGSGPIPISTRRSGGENIGSLVKLAFSLELRPDTSAGTITMLSNYLKDFGRGSCQTRTEDQRLWLDLQCREDVELLKTQFADLLSNQRAADEPTL